jgi:GNAT superfamily N-acetyltransferase
VGVLLHLPRELEQLVGDGDRRDRRTCPDRTTSDGMMEGCSRTSATRCEGDLLGDRDDPALGGTTRRRPAAGGTPGSYRRTLDEIDRQDGCFLLVGEYDRQIGAVLEMIVFPTLSGPGRTAEIVGLWTAEPFRTSGLDGMLLDHAIARADDLGCTRIQVLAAGSRRHEHAFWERAGFVHLDAGYVRTSRVPLRRIS